MGALLGTNKMQLIATEPHGYDPDNPDAIDYKFVYGDSVMELYTYCTPEMVLVDS